MWRKQIVNVITATVGIHLPGTDGYLSSQLEQRDWSQEETGLSRQVRLPKTSFTCHFTRTRLHPKDTPSSNTLQEQIHFKNKGLKHLLTCSVFIKVRYLSSTYYVSGTELGSGGTDNIPAQGREPSTVERSWTPESNIYPALDLRLWYVHAV